MFKCLRADADFSQELELRGMVSKSLSSLETFGSVSEQDCFKASLKISGRSCWGIDNHFDFQREISSSGILGLGSINQSPLVC